MGKITITMSRAKNGKNGEKEAPAQPKKKTAPPKAHKRQKKKNEKIKLSSAVLEQL